MPDYTEELIDVVRANFINELANIRTAIKEMGDKTTLSVRTAVNSFITNDVESAMRSRQYEKDVDNMYKDIDDKCITTIATQQPAAADLRFLVSTIKIASEIERIADYANNIAKIVQKKFPRMELTALAPLSGQVQEIGNQAADMLNDAIRAYEYNDPNLSSQVRERDDAVNKCNKELLRELLNIAIAEPTNQEVVIEYTIAIRYIERVADRATNIAEWVFYTATGFRMKDKKA